MLAKSNVTPRYLSASAIPCVEWLRSRTCSASSALHPILCTVRVFKAPSMGFSCPHSTLHARSFATAISSPKIIAKAETMSAFACSPARVDLADTRSSAYPVSRAACSCPSARNSGWSAVSSSRAQSKMSKNAIQLSGEPTSPCPVPTSA